MKPKTLGLDTDECVSFCCCCFCVRGDGFVDHRPCSEFVTYWHLHMRGPDQVHSERCAHLGVTYALDMEYRRQPSYTHVAAAAAAAYRTQQLGSKISNTYWVMGNPCTVASTTVPTLLMAVSIHHLPLSSSPPTSSSFFSGQACGHSCLHVRKWKTRYYSPEQEVSIFVFIFYFVYWGGTLLICLRLMWLVRFSCAPVPHLGYFYD